MGGRELLQEGIETKRIDRDSFDKLYKELEPKLKTIYEKVELIPFYRTKQDFGDMDILVSEPKSNLGIKGANDFRLLFQKLFNPNVIIHNGNVWSFDQDSFQIDIIKTKPKFWDTTLTYYSYNDLGNLMGRIARRLGFRYGHQGLTYSYKSKYGFSDTETIVSQNVESIFEFLGFNYGDFVKGFDTLEEIFVYVVNSEFFNPDIFAYENLDHTNRVRNRKRDSYQKFIEYISNFKMDDSTRALIKQEMYSMKGFHFDRAIEIFGSELTSILKEYEESDEKLNSIRQKFNGNIVMELTGLKGKELGAFITLFKNIISNNFNEYVLNNASQQIREDIVTVFKIDKNKKKLDESNKNLNNFSEK